MWGRDEGTGGGDGMRGREAGGGDGDGRREAGTGCGGCYRIYLINMEGIYGFSADSMR